MLLLEPEESIVGFEEPGGVALLADLADQGRVEGLRGRCTAGAGPVALGGHRVDHRLGRHRRCSFAAAVLLCRRTGLWMDLHLVPSLKFAGYWASSLGSRRIDLLDLEPGFRCRFFVELKRLGVRDAERTFVRDPRLSTGCGSQSAYCWRSIRYH